MSAPDIETGHRCPSCDTIYREGDLSRLYECSRCGSTSVERRCDACNIFMARAGEGCEDCATECEEVEAVVDHDGELVLVEDYDPDISKGERDAASRARSDRERAEAEARRRAERDAAAQPVAAADVRVGDWITHPEPGRYEPEGVQVLALYDWGQRVGLVITEHGMAQVVSCSTDERLSRIPHAPAYGRDMSESFGVISFDPNVSARTTMSSAPQPDSESFQVVMSRTALSFSPRGPVPALTIKHASGNFGTTFGAFVDRAAAQEALDTWEQIALSLAETQGVEAVPNAEGITVKEEAWASGIECVGQPVEVFVGTDKYSHTPNLAALDVVSNGRMHTTYADPCRLLAAVQAARGCLDHLNSKDGQ